MSLPRLLRISGLSILVGCICISCGGDTPPWLLDAGGDAVVDAAGPGPDAVDDRGHGTDAAGRDLAGPDAGNEDVPGDVSGEDSGGGDDTLQDDGGRDAAVDSNDPDSLSVPDGVSGDAEDFFICIPDCSAVECGPDPVCGQFCGSCDFGHICRDGTCHLWLPEDHDVNCKNGMCLVPAGPFLMGCNFAVDQDCEFDETPMHEVTLSAYWIDKYEVTVAEYRKCVDAGVCNEPVFCQRDEPDPGDIMCNWGVPGRELHPVHHLNVEDAKDYCAWAGKRLPTEAEWEKADRGTDGRKYPWGIAPASCEYAVMMEVEGSPGCGEGHTLPVGSKPAGASPYGVMDMAGNVWEFVHDWYREDYYVISPAIDPQGPASGAVRGLRGGAFNYKELSLRTSDRDRPNWYDSFDVNIGFRCVKDAAGD